MPLYTRTGDSGTTSLCGGIRVKKDDVRVEVCGTIDELSAMLGLVRTERLLPNRETAIIRIQCELIGFCAEIVSDSGKILPEHILRLEGEIDAIASELPPLTEFILAGSSRTSALFHLARTICRRAERSLTTLLGTQNQSPLAAYLNRLSDLLFVMAREADAVPPG